MGVDRPVRTFWGNFQPAVWSLQRRRFNLGYPQLLRPAPIGPTEGHRLETGAIV